MSRSDAPGRASAANLLLSALPTSEYDRLLPQLEPFALRAMEVLYEPGEVIRHVHFPTSGVVSLIVPSDERPGGVEAGVIGSEGMVGLPVFLGTEIGTARALVQVPGEALRMRSRDLRSWLSQDSQLQRLLLHYTHSFLIQVSQTVACNALHLVPRRLAGWLLRIQSRVGTDQFPLTHELLAIMLGVRRASITEAAQNLQKRGLIRYARGQVTVQDRPGLEAAACNCHRIIQSALDRRPSLS